MNSAFLRIFFIYCLFSFFSCGKDTDSTGPKKEIEVQILHPVPDIAYEEKVNKLRAKVTSLGFILQDDFLAIKSWEQVSILNLYIDEMNKIPHKIIEEIKKADLLKIYLTTGSVTNFSKLKDRADDYITNDLYSRKYKDLSAMTQEWGVVIAADKNNTEYTTAVLIHEITHLWEIAIRNNSGTNKYFPISRSNEFLLVHRLTPWKSVYELDLPQEALALAISNYYHSDESRKYLQTQYPLAYDYVVKLNL
ncbi:MAG: hypothetical protein HQK53_15300 [Oligoflexia bacterium]|nr:hypothetical protein [Oligoflexia bacterium]